MAPYVTFLLDLGAERANRTIAETVRYAPDPTHLPRTAFHWKVVCDANGAISIRANANGKQTLIAAATLEGGLIRARRQREPNVPTGPQWGFVAAALEAELASRAASGEPEDPALVEPISDEEARYLRGASSDVDTTFRYNDPPKEPAKKPTGRLLPLGLAAAIVVVAMIVVPVIRRARSKATTPAPPPAAPAPRPIEQQIAAAPTLQDAIALARTDATGLVLANYPRLRWAEVDVAPETSIGHVQKDVEAERGKRMCADGTIEKIERRDVGRRKVFVGRMHLADGDAVTFVALGTTGELIKRSAAKFCGAVIGQVGDDPMLVGLFDLPENRSPIVEQ